MTYWEGGRGLAPESGRRGHAPNGEAGPDAPAWVHLAHSPNGREWRMLTAYGQHTVGPG